MYRKRRLADILKTKRIEEWLIIILIILNLFLTFSASRTRKELNYARREELARDIKIGELEIEKLNLEDENTALQSSLEYYKRKSLYGPELLPQELEELSKKGLKNPIMDIKTNLMNHNELIPFESVMGGKMRFASERDIYVVSTRWVRAHFEDGHNGGWILLEYQVSNEGKISWKVIKSYIDY